MHNPSNASKRSIVRDRLYQSNILCLHFAECKILWKKLAGNWRYFYYLYYWEEFKNWFFVQSQLSHRYIYFRSHTLFLFENWMYMYGDFENVWKILRVVRKKLSISMRKQKEIWKLTFEIRCLGVTWQHSRRSIYHHSAKNVFRSLNSLFVQNLCSITIENQFVWMILTSLPLR